MDKLPPEILLEIFGNLELEDLFSTSGVCVKWYRIVNHMLATKRRIHLIREEASLMTDDGQTAENVAVINKADLVECLKQFLPNLRQLFVAYDDDDDCSNTDRAFDMCASLEMIFKSAVNLVSLNLIGSVPCTRRLIATLIQHCPDAVETISLRLRNKNSTDKEESELRESLRLIKSQMFGEYLRETKIAVAEPSTSKLYAFYNNVSLPSGNIGLAVANDLCELHLLNCCGLSAGAYKAIGLAKNLKAVTLKHAYDMDASGVTAISRLPRLESLSVSDAVRVNEDGWKSVFTGCTSLTALKLKRCAQLSDSVFGCGVFAVCRNLKRLKLDLENCKQVTSAGLKSLLTACVRLVSLNVCVDYDEQTVSTLRRCLTDHLHRLTSSVVVVQTALATTSGLLFENLPPHCSFIVKRTKIVFT